MATAGTWTSTFFNPLEQPLSVLDRKAYAADVCRLKRRRRLPLRRRSSERPVHHRRLAVHPTLQSQLESRVFRWHEEADSRKNCSAVLRPAGLLSVPSAVRTIRSGCHLRPAQGDFAAARERRHRLRPKNDERG